MSDDKEPRGITVTLDDIGLATVIGEIWHESGPEPVTVGDRVARMITDKLTSGPHWDSLAGRYRDIRDEMLRAKLEPMVEAALGAPVRITNSFGEPTGPEVSWNELIASKLAKVLGQPSSSHGSGRSDTYLDKLIKDAASEVIRTELASLIPELRKEIKAKIAQGVAEKLT